NAEIIRGKLESEGIPVRIEYEAAGRIYAITIDGLGEVKIKVPSEWAERAGEILLEIFDDGELPWDVK
ncbi:MAG TPA: DUF2007 domain-containing protein, partial [Syntrophales bacterium]|nr:DUF2007 domain-containing protein [Syntrophales bacterium]